MGYNALYQRFLPGAFNVLVFESDGLPNTMAMNLWDGSDFAFASVGSSGAPLGCKDGQAVPKSKYSGGWNTFANRRDWRTTTYSLNSITPDTPHAGAYPDVPPGVIGGIYSSDPSMAKAFQLMANPFDPSGNSGLDRIDSVTTSCLFNSGSSTSNTKLRDFAWLPGTDIVGNSVKPALNPYKSGVLTSGGHLTFNTTARTFLQNWTNFHDAALNAADNAAYRARANTTVKPTVFVIGLGGQGLDPIDHTLLQRIANDPKGDINSVYPECVANASCVHYDDQYSGTYIYSTNATVLKQKFLELSSQILRLSR
jgi:hypothetical protein